MEGPGDDCNNDGKIEARLKKEEEEKKRQYSFAQKLSSESQDFDLNLPEEGV